MLNIFMSLIVGTTAGMWVGSRKTCTTWQRILCCGLLSPPGAKYPSGTYQGGPACKPLMTQTAAALTSSRTSGQTQGTMPSYQMTMLPQSQPHSISSYPSYQQRKYQPWIQPTTTASSEASKPI